MPPLHYLLLLLSFFVLHVSSASNPTSFCKCICGSNSTIIPLDAPSSSSSPKVHDIRSLPLPKPRLLRPRDVDDEATPPADEPDNRKGGEDDKKGKDEGKDERKEYRKKTCNDCNKQYCLSQHLHICEGKAAEEVFATCFQRDSRKDEAVVFIFIVATVGLLGWAAVKPWVGKWIDRARERRTYIPVSGEGDT